MSGAILRIYKGFLNYHGKMNKEWNITGQFNSDAQKARAG